jgi:hypothetical protein
MIRGASFVTGRCFDFYCTSVGGSDMHNHLAFFCIRDSMMLSERPVRGLGGIRCRALDVFILDDALSRKGQLYSTRL